MSRSDCPFRFHFSQTCSFSSFPLLSSFFTIQAPSPEAVTDAMYDRTKTIEEYLIADLGGDIDLSVCRTYTFGNGSFEVRQPFLDCSGNFDFFCSSKKLFDFVFL